MAERLTRRDISELRALAKSPDPLWGGVYERGGDPDIYRWTQAGLIKAVRRPYAAGKLHFSGGYVITPFGRAALKGEAP